MTPIPIKGPSDVIKTYYYSNNKQLAKDTERAIRAAEPAIKIWSCSTQEELDKYITNDPDTIAEKEKCQILQQEKDPVLIIGPTGTGKELLARSLHGGRTGKFVAVNCTALPDELLESELFGHVKGAFTGAVEDRVGKFRSAFGGTIFLDEIGDMPPNMQAKLLRVLQENVVTPVGSDKEEKINCRVVAATNRKLEELLGSLHFREDLYWRLAGVVLRTKGLHERICDLEDIVDAIGGEKMMNEIHKRIGENNYSLLDLRGNVRSLQAQVRKYQLFGQL